MDFNSKTFYQAVLFGISILLIYLLLSEMFEFLKPNSASECENKYYVIEISMILSGIIIRYLLVNKQIAKYMYEE